MEYFLSILIVALFSAYVLYRNPPLLKPTAKVSAVAFVAAAIWDIIGTNRGWWIYTESFLLGPRIFGVPIEDYIGFVVVFASVISLHHIVKTGKI